MDLEEQEFGGVAGRVSTGSAIGSLKRFIECHIAPVDRCIPKELKIRLVMRLVPDKQAHEAFKTRK